MAIPEIRSTSDDIIPKFVHLVNSQGANYQYVVRPSGWAGALSKEQYAFIYETPISSWCKARCTRPPTRRTCCTTRATCGLVRGEELILGQRWNSMSASRWSISTPDRDQTDGELDACGRCVRSPCIKERDEDDVVVLGDLNVDERHLGELGRLSDITLVVSGPPTNRVGNKTYDNLIYNRQHTADAPARGACLRPGGRISSSPKSKHSKSRTPCRCGPNSRGTKGERPASPEGQAGRGSRDCRRAIPDFQFSRLPSLRPRRHTAAGPPANR